VAVRPRPTVRTANEQIPPHIVGTKVCTHDAQSVRRTWGVNTFTGRTNDVGRGFATTASLSL
jgi:hypothetical protein